ncbi:MAG: T9SS type A sorting domain-containing protein [Chitinophagales bacterium]|nr:T9SS type A sorting domain-containing protein [Chitinophagales bacterium]
MQLVFATAQYQLEWLTTPSVPNGRSIYLDDVERDKFDNMYLRVYESREDPYFNLEPRKYVVALDKNGNKKWEVNIGKDFMPEMNYHKILDVYDSFIYTPTLEFDTLKLHRIDTSGSHVVVYERHVPNSKGIVYDLAIKKEFNNHFYVDCQVRNVSMTNFLVEFDQHGQYIKEYSSFGLKLDRSAIGIDTASNLYTCYFVKDSGVTNTHIAKYDSNANVVWDTIVHNTLYSNHNFKVDAFGGIYFSKNEFITKFDSDHHYLWSINFSPYTIHEVKFGSNGDLFILIDKKFVNDDKLVRVDKNGNVLFNVSIPLSCDKNSFFVNATNTTTLATLLQKDYPNMPNRPSPYSIAYIYKIDSNGVNILNYKDTLYYPVYNRTGDYSRTIMDKSGNVYFNYNFKNPQIFGVGGTAQHIKQWMWYSAKYCIGCRDNVTGYVLIDTVADCIPATTEPGVKGALVFLDPVGLVSITNSGGKYAFTTEQIGLLHASVIPPKYLDGDCDTVKSFIVQSASVSSGEYFTLTPNPSCDVFVTISATRARFGFQQTIYVNYGNESAPSISGTIGLKLAVGFAISSSIPPYDSVVNNIYYWNYANLTVGDEREIQAVVSVSATFGTNFTHQAFITTNCSQGETLVEDSLSDIVFGSYDPNDKIVYPLKVRKDEAFYDINTTLTYQINFQNTGNDTAFRVVLRDTISDKLDLLSFRMLSASHSYEVNVQGKRGLEWVFKNIMLPDSTTNEPASHGFVKFSIRPNTNMPFNSVIYNSAAIYFDFNEPIFTNAVSTSYLKKPELSDSPVPIKTMLVFPNPTSGLVNLINEQQGAYDVFLVNSVGQKVYSELKVMQKQLVLDLSSFQSGLYTIRLRYQETGDVFNLKLIKLD